NMPSVLIAGCGYVGSATAKLFAEEGWEVIGWTRREQSAERTLESAISLCAVDITDLEAVRRNRFPADVVVHCASSGADSYLHVYRDGAPSTPRESLVSWTIPPRRGPRFWLGYRSAWEFRFRIQVPLRRQGAVVPTSGLAMQNCAPSAGSQPIPVIAKGLVVRSFPPSKIAARDLGLASKSRHACC